MTIRRDIEHERYLQSQSTFRKEQLKFRTSSSYIQNCYIRDHITEVILRDFKWQYWVTFTFGYKPYLEEVEDMLYKLHYRMDRRLIKHIPKKTSLSPDERTEWFLLPELKGRGLHYHGFIKLNVRPELGSYNDEWSWLRQAFKDNIQVLQKTLTHGGKMDFRLYNRTKRYLEDIATIVYSMKEFGKGASHTDQSPVFDRFAHTIVSRNDWKPSPLYQHRSPNKAENIPHRPNKIGLLGV